MARPVLLLALLLSGVFAAQAADSLACEGKLNKRGQKHGSWNCKKDGKAVRREMYKNGELKGYIIFNDKGEVIETRNRRGKVKKYTPCGC